MSNKKQTTSTPSIAIAIRILLLCTSIGCSSTIPTPKTPQKKKTPTFSLQLQEDLLMLSSTEFAGRGPFTKGQTKAASYIARQMEAAGLLPGEEDFFWKFEAPGSEFQVSATLRLAGKKSLLAKSNRNMVLYGGTPAREVEGMLFYQEFLDEKPIERFVENSIVILSETPTGSFDRADLQKRIHQAIQAGAKAVLTVPDDLYPPPLDPPALGQFPVPVARIHPAFWKKWKNDKKTSLGSGRWDLAKNLLFTSLGRPLRKAPNVFGRMQGKDPEKKAVVISAHYDHLGFGRFGWEPTGVFYPGADDNASGTAALLEAARLITSAPNCERPIFFVAYSLEEVGLLGSDAFAESQKDNILAVINLDMVGRRYGKAIKINGQPSKLMEELLTREIGSSWVFGEKATPKKGPQSDHSSFLKRGIPAISLTSGLHTDHHRSTDTVEKIDFHGATQIAELAASLARNLACTEESFPVKKNP